jgi:cell division protein ZapB
MVLAMQGDLDELEQRIERLIASCQALRAENQTLRTRVAGLEADRRRLADKVEAAALRLEVLMERLPE